MSAPIYTLMSFSLPPRELCSIFFLFFSFRQISTQIWLCHAVAIPCACKPSYSHLRGVRAGPIDLQGIEVHTSVGRVMFHCKETCRRHWLGISLSFLGTLDLRSGICYNPDISDRHYLPERQQRGGELDRRRRRKVFDASAVTSSFTDLNGRTTRWMTREFRTRCWTQPSWMAFLFGATTYCQDQYRYMAAREHPPFNGNCYDDLKLQNGASVVICGRTMMSLALHDVLVPRRLCVTVLYGVSICVAWHCLCRFPRVPTPIPPRFGSPLVQRFPTDYAFCRVVQGVWRAPACIVCRSMTMTKLRGKKTLDVLFVTFRTTGQHGLSTPNKVVRWWLRVLLRH